MKLIFTVNGNTLSREIKPSTLLIDLIRNELKLKGTKPGCLEGECGACTVLVDGKAINSCIYLAVNVEGREVTTIEGLVTKDAVLDEVQQKLIEHGAVQCGFCTSGMALSIKSHAGECMRDGYTPSREEITKNLEGNLCRCTGYVKIVDAAEAVFEN